MAVVSSCREMFGSVLKRAQPFFFVAKFCIYLVGYLHVALLSKINALLLRIAQQTQMLSARAANERSATICKACLCFQRIVIASPLVLQVKFECPSRGVAMLLCQQSSLQKYDERQAYFVKQKGTQKILPVIYWRKDRMTSSPHGPYELGYTRATMAITMGSNNVNLSKSLKIA